MMILDRYSEFSKFNGNWNFVGGKLILAADRAERDKNKKRKNRSQQDDADVGVADTILEGEVVATSEAGLVDNPVLRKDKKQNNQQHHTNEDNIVLDTHLSVPNGQVKIGKFFYPKHHPSFFDLPIYNPQLVTGSTFELQQVLGSLNTQQQHGKKDSAQEYHESDFYNKTFVLTSQPLPQHKPKQGRGQHWSIKYNKFVGTLTYTYYNTTYYFRYDYSFVIDLICFPLFFLLSVSQIIYHPKQHPTTTKTNYYSTNPCIISES